MELHRTIQYQGITITAFILNTQLNSYNCSLQAEYLNSTGRKYKGHFDMALKNQKHSLAVNLNMPIPSDLIGHVNTDCYDIDNFNRYGYVQMAKSLRDEFGFGSFESPDGSKLNQLTARQFIASRQNTKFAVLPVLSIDEKSLFKSSLARLSKGGKTIDFITEAKKFNRDPLVDGLKVCFKLPEHISSWFTTYSRARNRDLAIADAGIRRLNVSQKLLVPFDAPGVILEERELNTFAPDFPVSQTQNYSHQRVINLNAFTSLSSAQCTRIPNQGLEFQSRELQQGTEPERIRSAKTITFNEANFVQSSSRYKRRECLCCKIEGCPGRGGKKYCWMEKERNGELIDGRLLLLKRKYHE